MRWFLLTIGIYASNCTAADDKQLPKDQINCAGPYTMYTHPDKRCREKLAEEYKAMVKRYLETVRKSSPNREE